MQNLPGKCKILCLIPWYLPQIIIIIVTLPVVIGAGKFWPISVTLALEIIELSLTAAQFILEEFMSV